MIKIKHLMEQVESDDGKRIWVEPGGLTRDLVEWCNVDYVMSHLGPPPALWEWFERHPDGYEYFRGKYHQILGDGPYRLALRHLASAAINENFTLLHQGDDPQHNTATALYEFLSDLSAYTPEI